MVAFNIEGKRPASSPFVNLGMQHNGMRAEPWMKKVTTCCIVMGRRKGFAREHQNGYYMRLRNESKLTMLLVKISTESIYQSEYLFVGEKKDQPNRISPTCRANIVDMLATDTNVCRLGGVADRHKPRHYQPRCESICKP